MDKMNEYLDHWHEQEEQLMHLCNVEIPEMMQIQSSREDFASIIPSDIVLNQQEQSQETLMDSSTIPFARNMLNIDSDTLEIPETRLEDLALAQEDQMPEA